MTIKMNISFEFVDYAIGTKVLFEQNACKCLETESKLFPNLPIPLATLLGTTTTLGEAEQNAMSGDKVATDKKMCLTNYGTTSLDERLLIYLL